MQLQRNESLSVQALNALFATNHWAIKPEERLAASLDKMWGWLSAHDSNHELIGFVGILSDGIRHAYLLRMIVHPNYQRQGIGSAMMKELLQWLDKEGLQPTLVAVPGSEGFYERFGFSTQSNGYTAMCIRKQS